MDLLTLFLEQLSHPRTRRAYGNDLRTLMGTQGVTTENIHNLIETNSILVNLSPPEAGRPLSPSTLRRRRAALHSFLSWVQKEGAADVSAALASLRRINLGLAYKQTVEHARLDLEDIESIINAIGNDSVESARDRAIILFLFWCCLRRSELVRMDVEDVHFSEQNAYVDISPTDDRPAVFARIPPQACAALRKLMSIYEISSGPIWRSLSNNSLGRRLSARSVHAIVHRAVQQAGVSEFVNTDTIRLAGLVYSLTEPVSTSLDLDWGGSPNIFRSRATVIS